MGKPSDWHKMKLDEQKKFAYELFKTIRGQLIMGQALANAIKYMADEELPELSNIEDMEVLSVLFEPWFAWQLPPVEQEKIKAKLEIAYIDYLHKD